MRIVASLLSLLFPVSAVQADMYKCVNEHGRATYSNVQTKGCVRIIASPRTTPSEGGSTRATVPSGRNSATPSDFPRVDSRTQRTRDDGRRRILDTEMVNEQKSLDEARRVLVDREGQSASSKELQAGRDRIALHERNIEAIRKELSAIK